MATQHNNGSDRPEHPVLAIVIPAYNGREHLAETLTSALNQTFPASEILVVEDGSPRPAADIVAQFPGVRYIEKPNGGVSSARNFAVAATSAEWVCFLDQDDLLLPGHLQQFAEAIRAGSRADLFYTPRIILQQAGGQWTKTPATMPPSASDLPASLRLRCPFPPSGTCIRRSVFLQAGGYDSRYDLAEDWEFWLRLSTLHHTFHRCLEYTVCYRVHMESNSHRPIPILNANLRVIRERIFPSMTVWERIWIGQRLISKQEEDAGILLRHVGQPGGLRLVLRSILRIPFGRWRRYKIAAHMVAAGLQNGLRPRPRPNLTSQ